MYRGNLAVAVSAMGKLESVLRGMSRVPYRTAQVAAPRISGLLFEEFKQGRDPYGTPWEPISPNTYRKVTKRRWPPLTDTRRLRDGSMATAMPGGISIRMGRPEFYFHQVGTVTMPARPDPSRSRVAPALARRAEPERGVRRQADATGGAVMWRSFPTQLGTLFGAVQAQIATVRAGLGLPALNGPDGAGTGTIPVGAEYEPYQLAAPSIVIVPVGEDFLAQATDRDQPQGPRPFLCVCSDQGLLFEPAPLPGDALG